MYVVRKCSLMTKAERNLQWRPGLSSEVTWGGGDLGHTP